MKSLARITLAALLAGAAMAPAIVTPVALAQSVTTTPPPPADLTLALRRITELETALRDANRASDEQSRELFRLRLENERLKQALDTAQQAAGLAGGATSPPLVTTPAAPSVRPVIPPAPQPAASTPAPAPAPARGSPDGEAGAYRAALDLTTTDPAGAERALQAFIATYPRSARVGDATYFMGRTQYVQSKWTAAAATFLDIVEKTPRAPRAPEALVWLGASIRADGAASSDAQKIRTGCALMRELPARFPSASNSVRQLAQQELARTAAPGGQPICGRP